MHCFEYGFESAHIGVQLFIRFDKCSWTQKKRKIEKIKYNKKDRTKKRKRQNRKEKKRTEQKRTEKNEQNRQ